jgi:hypothetical protein
MRYEPALIKRNFTMANLNWWLLALVLIGGTMVTQAPSAKAENGQIAAGVAGGLIGRALLGGALAGPPFLRLTADVLGASSRLR